MIIGIVSNLPNHCTYFKDVVCFYGGIHTHYHRKSIILNFGRNLKCVIWKSQREKIDQAKKRRKVKDLEKN